MKNKKVVRLTESQLHNIIMETVSQILDEVNLQDYEANGSISKQAWAQKIGPKERPITKGLANAVQSVIDDISKA